MNGKSNKWTVTGIMLGAFWCGVYAFARFLFFVGSSLDAIFVRVDETPQMEPVESTAK